MSLTFGSDTKREFTVAKQTPSQSSPILHSGCGSQYDPTAHFPKLGPHFWTPPLLTGSVGITGTGAGIGAGSAGVSMGCSTGSTGSETGVHVGSPPLETGGTHGSGRGVVGRGGSSCVGFCG
jgi:hypothetical protein